MITQNETLNNKNNLKTHKKYKLTVTRKDMDMAISFPNRLKCYVEDKVECNFSLYFYKF